MNIPASIIVSILMSTLISVRALAAPEDIFTRTVSPAKDLLIFHSAKGEVVFSHSKHLKSLKQDQCIRCHRIENPTLEQIQSRFENHRIAHSFCKGCHREMGKGPTECHECHNYKKST
jgi:hypothetical protein